jgi:hypothetical protein
VDLTRTGLRVAPIVLMMSAILIAIELFVAAPLVFTATERYAAAPFPFAVAMTALPRFVVGLGAGILVRLIRDRVVSSVMLFGYCVLLFWAWHRYEAYVDWTSAHAVISATSPYLAGLLGIVIGLWLASVIPLLRGSGRQIQGPVPEQKSKT